MEKLSEQKAPPNKQSKEVLAMVLIGIGILWILKQYGLFFDFQTAHFSNLFAPVLHVSHALRNFFFSWPMVLIVVGLVLLAGKRKGGFVLLIIGILFILPKLFFFSGTTIILLYPVLLIGLGIALVAKLI